MIEERKNRDPILVEAEVIGKLHAVNAKKIGTPHARVAQNSVALTRSVTYTYNVAQFLEDVKSEFDDTFSNDVYNKLSMMRRVNKFSKDLLYSKQNAESDSEIVKKAEEISLADVSVPPAITLSEEFQAKCDELIEKYGGFKKGVSPARDVSVSKKVSDDKNVRQFTRTAIESSALDDESATRIMEYIVNLAFDNPQKK